jgi:mono/diheme cytochrome c family protein
MQNAKFIMQTLLRPSRLVPLCILHFAFCIVLSAREPQGLVATPAEAEKQLATINTYCVGCHNDGAKIGGVSFQGLTAASVAERGDVFEKAVRKLRGRVMPPPGAKQPAAATAEALVSWLETSLDRAEGVAHVRDRLVLHRLNRKEYANAVRDLLAVDFEADKVLPADDIADGFDNIADALQVSPSFIEQYVIAARSVAVNAVGQPNARPGGWTFRAGPGTQLTHVPGLPLGTRGGILANVDLPADGEYVIDIADIVTHIWGNGMEFENPIAVTVDNKLVYETVIGGEEDMKLYDQVQNGALDRVNARLKNISSRRPPALTRSVWHSSGGRSQNRTISSRCSRRAAGRIGSIASTRSRFAGRSTQGHQRRRRAATDLHLQAASGAAASDSEVREGDHRGAAKRAYRRPVSAEDVNELFQYYQDGAKAAASTKASAARSPACWPARSSSIARAASRGLKPGDSTRSAASSWRRTSRSSFGTPSRTTSCCSWRSTGS